jgi:hypothetical protein
MKEYEEKSLWTRIDLFDEKKATDLTKKFFKTKKIKKKLLIR